MLLAYYTAALTGWTLLQRLFSKRKSVRAVQNTSPVAYFLVISLISLVVVLNLFNELIKFKLHLHSNTSMIMWNFPCFFGFNKVFYHLFY